MVMILKFQKSMLLVYLDNLSYLLLKHVSGSEFWELLEIVKTRHLRMILNPWEKKKKKEINLLDNGSFL